jgi:hypothetical protein
LGPVFLRSWWAAVESDDDELPPLIPASSRKPGPVPVPAPAPAPAPVKASASAYTSVREGGDACLVRSKVLPAPDIVLGAASYVCTGGLARGIVSVMDHHCAPILH